MSKRYHDPRWNAVWPILKGETMTGAAYSGTLKITPGEVDGHVIDWKTSAGRYQGIGLAIEGRLMLAFGMDNGCGLAVYSEAEDGIDAAFTSQAFKGAIGWEKVAGCQGFDHLNQAYRMEGWQPDRISYKGQVAFAEYGPLFLIRWAFDGDPGGLVGVGMVRHGRLITGYGFEQDPRFGCGCYELQADGTLKGEWASPAFPQTAIEYYGQPIVG